MSLPLFLQGLGSIGVFASRAFLPAFVTAVLLRFGPQVPWLARVGLLPHVRDVPTWFTSDVALMVLGLLAVLELIAERVPEAQEFLGAVHQSLKTGMAVLTYLGVLNATDQSAVAQVIKPAGLFDFLPVLGIGAGVYLASRVRAAVLRPLADADEDDDLGLQGLIRWVEDLWGGLGPVALIVVPLLTLAAFGLAVVILVVVERRVEARRTSAQVPCVNCGRPIHACALACPSCNAPVKEPRDVGVLGQPKNRPARLATHPYRLVAVKRCPVCASRFDRRTVKPTCGECGHRLMDDSQFARDYIAFIDGRMPLTCVSCFVLGLVPILGVVPGVIVYRLAIVAPYRRYIPPGRDLLLRWGIRLTILLLLALQWLPVAGGVALATVALIHCLTYRSVYKKLALAP